MEAINCLVMEWWNHILIMYRTMVIKTESKRRRALAYTQDRKHCGRKSSLLYDQNQNGCDEESHSISIGEASTSPSPTYNVHPSEMRRVFDLLDENKDGLICTEELQLFMKKLGFELSDQKVKDMVRTIDKNSDECIDFEEFLPLYSCFCGEEDRTTGEYENSHNCPENCQSVGDEEETLLKAFFVFDENKDGLISALELQQVLLRLGLPEGRSLMCCQKMIQRVDADGNGQVDFFEFKEMMCSDAFSFCRS